MISSWQLILLRMALKWMTTLVGIAAVTPDSPLCPGSASQAEKHFVVFKKTGTNIQEHLDSITTSTQPYLLAVGRRKKAVHQFFIVLDKNAITCRSASSLGAFDKLFKAHYVFATTYNPMLYNMFTFI